MVTFETIGDDGKRESTERKFEPLAFARFVEEKIRVEGPNEARFDQEGIGRIEMRLMFDDIYKVKYSFHERSIDSTFRFNPSTNIRQGGTSMQGSLLPDLGGKAGKLATILEAQMGFDPFEFAELDAASVGHENLTDYEFEYESAVRESDIVGADLG